MVDIQEPGDRWTIPDDRQLALRGRLEQGWSTFAEGPFNRHGPATINRNEQEIIAQVLAKSGHLQNFEEERIGRLVKKLESMRQNVLGDGETTCLICGIKSSLLKDSLRICLKCSKAVCSKCSVESTVMDGPSRKQNFCVICYEERQLWKKSGAWFFSTMPKYTLPSAVHRSKSSSKSESSLPPSSIVWNGSVRAGPANGENNLSDEDEDSDADILSLKGKEISEDRRSMVGRLHSIDVEEEVVIGRGKRSSAVVTERPTNLKERHHSHSRSQEFSMSDRDSLDGFPTGPSDRTGDATSQTVRRTQADTSDSDVSRDFMGSSHELDKSHGRDKFKLGIKNALRKPSKDSKGDLKSLSRSAASLDDIARMAKQQEQAVAKSEGVDDIDSMFKSYKSDTGDASSGKEFNGKYGMIEFTLQYDRNTLELLAIINCCKGLKTSDKGGVVNPYIKTHLLPGASKASKKRTMTIKRNNDPVFNESLTYHGVPERDIQQKELRLTVMDDSRIGSNNIIGETTVPLRNLASRPVQHFRRILEPHSSVQTQNGVQLDENPGRIELALHFLSKKEQLVVEIIRCAGLKAMDPNGYSDPYVKCYLLPDPQKRSKRKTAIKKKTLNPEFNEEFVYKITHQELAKRNLHVTVWDHDIGRKNDLIGGVQLGIDSTGDQLKHWFETLKTADKRTIRWHTLTENIPTIQDGD